MFPTVPEVSKGRRKGGIPVGRPFGDCKHAALEEATLKEGGRDKPKRVKEGVNCGNDPPLGERPVWEIEDDGKGIVRDPPAKAKGTLFGEM